MRRWSGLWAVMACVVVAGIVALPAPARAWQAFAKITNSQGVAIDGGSDVKGFEKQIVVLGLGNNLHLPVATDPGGGGASVGRLQVGPIQMVKGFDIASPKLVTQIGTGTALKVEITLFKTNATGTSVPGFKILLTGALLTEMDASYDPSATPSAIEKLEFVYQKLTWTDLTTGATGSTP